MATIQETKNKKGKSAYRVQIRLKGYPLQSATFTKLTNARNWAQDVESALRDGRYLKQVEAKKHTLSEMVDRYMENVLIHKKSNTSTVKLQLNWWKSEIGNHLLINVTPNLIAKYRDKLLTEKNPKGMRRTPSTVIRYLAAISHAFTIAMKEWEWIEVNPVLRITKPIENKARIRFLDDEERERLLDACKQSKNKLLYTCVILAISTGMRSSEIQNLKWKDVDLVKCRITIHETKNGDRRIVPLVGHAQEQLQELFLKKSPNENLVFPSPRKSRVDKPMRFTLSWYLALEQAKIEDFRFHDLRHCCASYLAMNQASIAEIAEVLGHKTFAMVKRYSHLSESHTSKIVSKMNDQIFKKTAS